MLKNKFFILFWICFIFSSFARLVLAGGASHYSGINFIQLFNDLDWVNYLEIILGVLHFSVLVVVFKVFKK